MSKSTPRKFFGTDGVRGTANVHPITPEIAMRLGRAAARVLALGNQFGTGSAIWPKCVIGKDTRISCDMLEAAFAAGMTSEGVDVQLAGVVPTPAISFLVREEQASLGVVISASHNPFADNGIKFFNSQGYKLNDEQEIAIEEIVLADDETLNASPRPQAGKIGRISHITDGAERYSKMAAHSVGHDNPQLLKGLKIALDCANGASSQTSPQVLEMLGAEVISAYTTPNGVNINEDCGCTVPKEIIKLTKENGAHAGLSHDGDADRILICDENGELLDGDEIMAVIGINMLQNGTLKDNTLVGTIMSNGGLDEAIEAHGGKVVRAGVGDRFVMQIMQAQGYNFGGEQSGHIVCRDYNTTGDGIVAGLQILRIMVETGKPLSELRKGMTKFPQTLVALKVSSKPPIEELTEALALVAETEKHASVLLRYSGTEQKIRLLIEGKDEAYIKERNELISAAIIKQIGA
jgi:phosphoglucosamine mutase